MEYLNLVEFYQKLEATSKRLEKTYYISVLLKGTPTDDLEKITLLIQGKVFPSYDARKIGVAARLIIKSLNLATGLSPEKIEAEWKKTGDLGEAAHNLISKKSQATLFSKTLEVKKVFDNLRKLATLEGQGTVDIKVKLIAELLTSAKPLEAKYIVRTIMEDLRVGVGEGSLRDAIVWAFFPKVIGIFFKCAKCKEWMPNSAKCLNCNAELKSKYNDEVKKVSEENVLKIESHFKIKELEDYDFILLPNEDSARECYNYFINLVQEAYDITNDFGIVAKIAKTKGRGGLLDVKLEVGKPIKVMLYPKATDIDDAFETVKRPAAIEYKYDGFRLQIHKADKRIILYTRRLENVTKQFPEIVQYVKENVKADSFIIDSEAVGYDPKTGKYLAFQSISQRIRRKHGIEEMAKKFPVELNIFDIISHEGKTLLKEPFSKRRDILKKIVAEKEKKITLAKQLVTGSNKEAEAFYKQSLAAGEEGVMFKNLKGIYKPGARVGYGMKLKPVMETLDLVIVGAEWGTGKRGGWLSSFTLACFDPDTGSFLEIGKVGTGIKELEQEEGNKKNGEESEANEGVTFEQLTEMIKPLIINEEGREVKATPAIVIEVKYEEIQKSPNYGSGFALRFPRLVRLREDRAPDEISTISEVEELYKKQRGRG